MEPVHCGSSTGFPQFIHRNLDIFSFYSLRYESTIQSSMDSKTSALLEVIASGVYEDHESEWREALNLLRLKASYIPAVQVILKRGKWRSHPSPVAYIRKAAMWCAVRMNLVDPTYQSGREVLVADLNYTDSDGGDVPHDEKIDMALTGYEAKFGSYYYYGDDSDPSYRVAEDLAGSGSLVDWERTAELAGLDVGERMVLEIQLMEVGREQALSLCYTDDDRKYLQAAWKRFVRHREALKRTLQSGDSHQSRRIKKGAAEKPLELVFIEMADGSLRISFRELVPE
jgi:hypothetical protein